MDSQEQEKTQTASVSNPFLLRLKCFLCHALNPNVNDENNNLKKTNNRDENSFNPISKLPLYTCPDCEAKLRAEEKETKSSSTLSSQNPEENAAEVQRISNGSSDSDSEDEDEDQCCCSACLSSMEDEENSKYQQLFAHLSHLIKCLYRSTDQHFSENPFSNDIAKAKRSVKKLTKMNPKILFNQLESIALEYVREIRKQVLERYQTCSRTSHDVQLFIRYLLDEYQMFVQSATNVSTILLYLEENYLKSFKLSWLLYNKHLYEELIYMDRKIHHSMSTMIDLLQPVNDEENGSDECRNEYTQLLNRFLAFDEEMTEVAFLYKEAQAKMIEKSLEFPFKRSFGSKFDLKSEKKKFCEKSDRNDENSSKKSMTTAVDIRSSSNSSSTSATTKINGEIEQGSNASSVGSELVGDEYSSMSSTDDHLLDHETSSSGYTQEEQEELANLIFNDEDMNEYLLQEILNSVSPYGKLQEEFEQSLFPSTTIQQDDQWIRRIIHGDSTTPDPSHSTSKEHSTEKKSSSATKSKSSSSRRRKESSISAQPTPISTTQIPKKSIAADLLLPRSIADISAKIKSVSFTAGTFGSITSNDASSSTPSASSANSSGNTAKTGQTRLSINLTRKANFKGNEHGGQKIAEVLFNELTSMGTSEHFSRENSATSRKKDSQPFKKSKQQRTNPMSSTMNETFSHPLFSSSSSSNHSLSMAYNNLDQLLRHAASNSDVSEPTLHSILSTIQSSTSNDNRSSKHSISSKTTEALQTFLAQQQQHHHLHHHQRNSKKNSTENSKRCEFCCCDFPEGRSCSASTSLHFPTTSSSPSSTTTNPGSIPECLTCMALPTSTSTTTTTSVMGTTITGTFNPRDIQRKERLKLKFNKKTLQHFTEQQSIVKEPSDEDKAQSKKISSTKINEKKTNHPETNTKTKEFPITDQNNIDDLVRFIDGDDKISSNGNEHSATSNPHESTSKKNKKKKEKQSKTKQQEQKTNGNVENPSTTAPPPATVTTTATVTATKTNTNASKPPSTPTEQPLSKRKQKAKLKKQQQPEEEVEKEKEEEPKSINETKSSNPPSTQDTSNNTNSSQSKNVLTRETFESPEVEHEEEEVNWITISRKQSKHKATPAAVPSLLATPVLPVLPPSNPKQSRQTSASSATAQTNTNSKRIISSSSSSSSATVSPIVQQKVIPPTSNLSPHPSLTTTHPKVAPTRAQTTSKPPPPIANPMTKIEPAPIQPSTNLWKTNQLHENHTTVIPPTSVPSSSSSSSSATTAVPTQAISSMPPSTLLTPTGMTNTFLPSHSIPPSSSSSLLSEEFSSSIGWDSNTFLLPVPSSSSLSIPSATNPSLLPLQPSLIPSTTPGPVQRPHPSFSPAPGPISTTTSRCIQRPSPELRLSSTNNHSYPMYFPMNYSGGNVSSTWDESTLTNTHETQWKYPSTQDDQGHFGLTASSNDFPLYDPFHSGAGLTIPSTTSVSLLNNGFPEPFSDLCAVPQTHDINDMDALDKEIEDFKKFCFEQVPLETREKVQVNLDRCFVRQA